MWLADFHTHSQFSDGKLSIPELVDFYGQLGFGAIAITDHLCEEKTMLGKAAAYLNRTLTKESFNKYLSTIKCEAERAWEQYHMLVIPGIEFTKNSLQNHRSAHILGLGIQEYVPADLPIEELLQNIREQGGLSVAAHPVSRSKWRGANYILWDRRHEISSLVDAWEMTESGQILPEVLNSKLPKLATSDLHRPSQIQSWKTAFNCERKIESVFDSIRLQRLGFRFFSLQSAQKEVA